MKALPQPRKEPRQARSKKTVDVILEATARVLSKLGYAGMNTNSVAQAAGVSIGSVYQYFPNKDSLVTALHERHAAQIYEVIENVLASSQPRSLRGHVEAMVHAILAAHQLDPRLHKVLEKEFPFFDAPRDESPSDSRIYLRVHALLERYRAEIAPRNLALAAWTVLQVIESLVHAAVIEPPKQFATPEIEAAICQTVMGYLSR
jgi:AcrR family transcriptional regulator